MVELYVVRHGETEFNKKNIIIGHEDPSILQSSIPVIERLAKKLPSIDIIFSSDLRRTRETAQELQKVLGVACSIHFSSLLREVDYGELSGKEKVLTSQRHPKYHKDVDFIHPSGESFSQLYERIVQWFESVRDSDKKILVVTHAGAIRALYSYINDLPFEQVLNLPLGHEAVLKCSEKEAVLL